MLKKLVGSDLFRRSVASVIAGWFRFVRATCRMVVEPAPPNIQTQGQRPLVVTSWHGEHFMLPFAKPPGWTLKAMISRSRDGELNALVAEKLGIGTIRASGGRDGKEVRRRGGVYGFVAALRELEQGFPVMLTADVPKVGKVAGDGVVQLAKYSGCPILPVAAVTSRRRRLKSWDRAAFNLPFGRFAVVLGAPIEVARDADDATLEAKRREVEAELNRIHARAYELAGGRDG